MLSAICFNLNLSKILSSGNGLSVQLNFVGQSVLYSGAFIRRPPNLPDMAGGLTVFQKVDRSVKQIKFHLKSHFIPHRKTDIYSNNLPKSEVRNLF